MSKLPAFALVFLAGCGTCSPEKPKEGVTLQKFIPANALPAAPPQTLQVVFAADAGASSTQGQRLETYVGFSSDGLAFAFGQVGAGGIHALQIASSTTDTVERMIPLDTDAHRNEAMQALKDDGFPALTETQSIPKELAVTVQDGQVRLLFSGLPVGAVKAFAGKPSGTLKADIVAVSRDGKRAAIRVTSVTNAPPETEFHVLPVFP